MISPTDSSPLSPSVSETACSETAACSSGTGTFNSRTTCCSTAQAKCQADDADWDEQRPLAQSAIVMRKVALEVFARRAPSPLDVEERLRQVIEASGHHGLAHDPQLIACIDQLGTDISKTVRFDLEKQIRLAVYDKHGENLREALTAISHMQAKPKSLLVRLRNALKASDDALLGAFATKDLQAIKVHLSHCDLLFTLLKDFATLLQQKTCPGSLSQLHYINMTSYAKTSLTVEKKGTLVPDVTDNRLTSVCIGNIVVAYAHFHSSYNDRSIVQLINDLHSYQERELEIGVCITKSSAGALKSYLNNLQINRLYLPIAGSGYFARVMMDEEMSVTCSDLLPPEKTFIHVKKSELFTGIRQFAKTLATLNQSITETAMTFDAPSPLFSRRGNYETIANLVPRIARFWFEQGGKYLLVFSEAADMETLFSLEMLATLSIRLEPVLPGFGPEIFLGLGICVGNCGVYRIDGTSEPS